MKRNITKTELVCLFVGFLVCLSVENITEKSVNGFSPNFHDNSGMEQGTLWNIWS